MAIFSVALVPLQNHLSNSMIFHSRFGGISELDFSWQYQVHCAIYEALIYYVTYHTIYMLLL